MHLDMYLGQIGYRIWDIAPSSVNRALVIVFSFKNFDSKIASFVSALLICWFGIISAFTHFNIDNKVLLPTLSVVILRSLAIPPRERQSHLCHETSQVARRAKQLRKQPRLACHVRPNRNK